MIGKSESLSEEDNASIARANVEMQKTIELLNFAKFGFRGTLATGFAGMILILLLAVLDSLTEFNIESWALVAIAFIILIGGIAFGYFSLGKLPNVAAQIKDMSFSVESAQTAEDADKQKKG